MHRVGLLVSGAHIDFVNACRMLDVYQDLHENLWEMLGYVWHKRERDRVATWDRNLPVVAPTWWQLPVVVFVEGGSTALRVLQDASVRHVSCPPPLPSEIFALTIIALIPGGETYMACLVLSPPRSFNTAKNSSNCSFPWFFSCMTKPTSRCLSI